MHHQQVEVIGDVEPACWMVDMDSDDEGERCGWERTLARRRAAAAQARLLQPQSAPAPAPLHPPLQPSLYPLQPLQPVLVQAPQVSMEVSCSEPLPVYLAGDGTEPAVKRQRWS